MFILAFGAVLPAFVNAARNKTKWTIKILMNFVYVCFAQSKFDVRSEHLPCSVDCVCSIIVDDGECDDGDSDCCRSIRASDRSGLGLFLFGNVWSLDPPVANNSRSFELRHFMRRF